MERRWTALALSHFARITAGGGDECVKARVTESSGPRNFLAGDIAALSPSFRFAKRTIRRDEIFAGTKQALGAVGGSYQRHPHREFFVLEERFATKGTGISLSFS